LAQEGYAGVPITRAVNVFSNEKNKVVDEILVHHDKKHPDESLAMLLSSPSKKNIEGNGKVPRLLRIAWPGDSN
jgi:hypothetical protein